MGVESASQEFPDLVLHLCEVDPRERPPLSRVQAGRNSATVDERHSARSRLFYARQREKDIDVQSSPFANLCSLANAEVNRRFNESKTDV